MGPDNTASGTEEKADDRIENKDNANDDNLLAKSAIGATLLIILQIASRAVTFAANQVLLRFLSPDILGVSTQLEVYSMSILHFSREALRVAIQRQTESPSQSRAQGSSSTAGKALGAQKSQSVVNLAHVSLVLGAFFTLILNALYRTTLRADAAIGASPFFKEALWLYTVATAIELLSEPCFMVVQQKSAFGIRASAESLATVLRCAATCGFAFAASRRGTDVGALLFAVGQTAYASCLLVVYLWKVWPMSSAEGFSLYIRPMASSNDYVLSYFSRPLLSLGTSLVIQGMIKHLLTQGDVILIASLASIEAQGVYAIVSNYGGLVARLVLQPIEESSRNYFGKMLTTIDGNPSRAVVSSAGHNLQNLIRFYGIVSIGIVTVGPSIAPQVLSVIAGPRWAASGAGVVLSKYCYYIPLLAVNGITEAFISAVATESELNIQSVWMLAFSAAFAAASYVFLRVLDMGAEGLVWANLLNMALRIVWSLAFIGNYMSRNAVDLQISPALPKSATFALSIGMVALLQHMQPTQEDSLKGALKVLAAIGSYAVLMLYSEREYILQTFRYIAAARQKKKKP